MRFSVHGRPHLLTPLLRRCAAGRLIEGLAGGWLVRGDDGRLCIATMQPSRQQLLIAMQAQEVTLAAYDVVVVGDRDPVPVERFWAAMASAGGPSAVGAVRASAGHLAMATFLAHRHAEHAYRAAECAVHLGVCRVSPWRRSI